MYSIGGVLGLVDYSLAERCRKMEEEKRSLPLTSNKKITILLPALNEEEVIARTIDNVATLNHPNYRIVIATHPDDTKTTEASRVHIQRKGYNNVSVQELNYKPKTKPSVLNFAFSNLDDKPDIIGILDAENWFKNKDVLRRIEQYFLDPNVGAVQTRIVPVYEKGKVWQQLVQLTACVEFAELYSLPTKKEAEQRGKDEKTNGIKKGSLLDYGKMSIKDRFTTPFLGGTGCFYSYDVLEQLAKMREEQEGEANFVPGPFIPNGLTEDFQSAIKIISELPNPRRIVYDSYDEVYAYFPDEFGQRLKQETRWHTGKIDLMLRTNVLKLKSTRPKKFEIAKEFFFTSTPVVNFAALGYMGWTLASSFFGVRPSPPDHNLFWIMLGPALYAVTSTSDQVYKSCRIYRKRILSKESLKYLVASLLNQWIVQPAATSIAYGKVIKSQLTGKRNGWEKTKHKKIDHEKLEGIDVPERVTDRIKVYPKPFAMSKT